MAMAQPDGKIYMSSIATSLGSKRIGMNERDRQEYVGISNGINMEKDWWSSQLWRGIVGQWRLHSCSVATTTPENRALSWSLYK